MRCVPLRHPCLRWEEKTFRHLTSTDRFRRHQSLSITPHLPQSHGHLSITDLDSFARRTRHTNPVAHPGGATYGIGVARNGHWMYNVTSNGSQTWYHLAGMNRLGQMVTTRGTEYYFRSGRWLGSLEGIPIFFPGAAGTATSSGNCFWTCIVGLRNGLIGF